MLINQIIKSKLLISLNNTKNISLYHTKEDFFEIDNFDRNFIYKNYNSVSFEFLGEKYILEKYNYTQLICKITDILYDLEPAKFRELAVEKYCPMSSDKIYISKDKNDIRDIHTLGNDDVFIETNLSSNYIIKFIFILINEFGLNNKDVKIYLSKEIYIVIVNLSIYRKTQLCSTISLSKNLTTLLSFIIQVWFLTKTLTLIYPINDYTL